MFTRSATFAFTVSVKVLSAVVPFESLTTVLTLYVPAVEGVKLALVAVPNSVPAVV